MTSPPGFHAELGVWGEAFSALKVPKYALVSQEKTIQTKLTNTKRKAKSTGRTGSKSTLSCCLGASTLCCNTRQGNTDRGATTAPQVRSLKKQARCAASRDRAERPEVHRLRLRSGQKAGVKRSKPKTNECEQRCSSKERVNRANKQGTQRRTPNRSQIKADRNTNRS